MHCGNHGPKLSGHTPVTKTLLSATYPAVRFSYRTITQTSGPATVWVHFATPGCSQILRNLYLEVLSDHVMLNAVSPGLSQNLSSNQPGLLSCT